MERGAAAVSNRMTKNIHRILAAFFMTASLAATSAPAMAASHHRHHRTHHHHAIPQHNRGDRDGDNNGGHDDRDGQV
jgi:hypothetical protein